VPTLEQATKPPVNLAQMVEVLQPQNPPAPVLTPREQPGLANASLGPAPDTFTTAYDRIRQWFRPGTSQQRFPPLPSKVNPSLNASAASVSRTVSTEVVNSIAPDDDTPAVNLQTGTNYTVVPGDLNKLISISNASGGIIYLPPVAGTTNVALNNNVVSPFTAGNSVSAGSVVTSTYTFTPTVDINAGDYIMWTGRRVMSPGETAIITMNDSQNGNWTVRYTNQDNPGIGAENNAIGYVQNLTKIPAGSSITVTLIATFSSTLFNPGGNGIWSVSGLKGLDQEALAHATSAGTPYSSGGLTLQQNCFLVSSQNSDTGDISPVTPANTQGLVWTTLAGNSAPAFFTASYILTAGPGIVNDVYAVTGTTARIDRLVSFSIATQSETLRLKDNFFCYVENKGTGSFQLHSTALIDGSQNNVTLSSGQGCLLVYDSTSGGWYTMRGIGGTSSGTVTHTGALTAGQLIIGNGTADIKTGDLTGDATTSGSTAVSVVKVNGGSIPTSAAFVATNGSNQFTAAAYTPENVANKDAASGYAGLDSNTMLKVAEQQETVDARTSTSEAIANSDRGKLVTFSNTSAIAATIAQAGAGSLFIAGWWADILNINTGTVTLTPTTSTINGQTTLVLEAYEGGRIVSDGTNYKFITGSVTQDTPNDSDVLTFETATKRWRAKAIGTLGGANASQLRGNNISSSTPTNQQVLKWITADNQYDLVLADGMQHGDTVWWSDSAFNEYREDFNSLFTTSTKSGTAPVNQIGRLGWSADWQTNSKPKFTFGGIPPYLGQYSWENNGTANQLCPLMFPNSQGATTTSQQAQALLDKPGWKASFVFRVTPCGIADSSGIGFFGTQRKAIYVGFSGATTGAFAAATPVSSRPDVFIGLRYDTSSANGNGMIVTSIANASAGSTVYTGTFGNGTSNAFAGISFTIRGASNAANNGTFACTASTATTLTLSNASGVAETITSSVTAYQVSAYPSAQVLTAAAAHSGSSTTYTMVNMGGFSSGANNAYAGVTFVIAGFTNAANNGTFACTASTATTLVLSNGAGIAETHAGTATVSGSTGIVGDTVYTFEATFNQQYSTLVRHYAVGQQATTTLAPANDGWHRLDISCTASGSVTLTLDGSSTNTVTFTITQMTHSSTGNSQVTNKLGLLSYTTGTSGTSGTPPVAPGTAVTLSGYTGGFTSLNGGTFNIFWAHDGVSSFTFQATGISDIANASQTPTVTFWPALVPIFGMGNDEFGNNSTLPAPVAGYMRFWADAFLLSWNNAITGSTTAPTATNPRYWS
jgi:hypothetical protein